MAGDSLDCKEDLVVWSWVTDGCDNNKGFYFEEKPPSSSSSSSSLESSSGHGAATQLVSGLPGAQQCVTASSITAGVPLKLGKCPTAAAGTQDDPGWDFGEHCVALLTCLLARFILLLISSVEH